MYYVLAKHIIHTQKYRVTVVVFNIWFHSVPTYVTMAPTMIVYLHDHTDNAAHRDGDSLQPLLNRDPYYCCTGPESNVCCRPPLYTGVDFCKLLIWVKSICRPDYTRKQWHVVCMNVMSHPGRFIGLSLKEELFPSETELLINSHCAISISLPLLKEPSFKHVQEGEFSVQILSDHPVQCPVILTLCNRCNII